MLAARGLVCLWQTQIITFLILIIPIALVPLQAYAKGDGPWNWYGFYSGVHVGYTDHAADITQNGVALGSGSSSGAGFGTILGLNFFHDNGFIIGIEGDFSWDERDVRLGGDVYELDHWGTFRLRAGYLIKQSLLIYATAGLAYADFDFVDNAAGGARATGSDHLWGFAVGGGLEAVVAQAVKVRAEYLYTAFEDWAFNSLGTAHGADSDAHIVRFGATYDLDSIIK